jgi:hypothetical protein
MTDTPLPAESVPTLNDIAKAAPAVPPVSESAAPVPEAPPLTRDTARGALESIAKGPQEAGSAEIATPAGPATQETPATQAGQAEIATQAGKEEREIQGKDGVNQAEQMTELGPNKEKLDSLFTQSAQVLLDAQDPRVITVALARASSDTPLGRELRQDTADLIIRHSGERLTPQARGQLTQIQEELRLLNLPKTDPARSEFANILESYAAAHPDRGITPELVEQVRTNAQSRPDGITNLMKTDSTLTAQLMAALQGDEKDPFPDVGRPEGLVRAAGLPMTPENHSHAASILRPAIALPGREPPRIADLILPTALGTSMMLMFVASLAGIGGGNGGH